MDEAAALASVAMSGVTALGDVVPERASGVVTVSRVATAVDATGIAVSACEVVADTLMLSVDDEVQTYEVQRPPQHDILRGALHYVVEGLPNTHEDKGKVSVGG
jgi:hypothetical protein